MKPNAVKQYKFFSSAISVSKSKLKILIIFYTLYSEYR